MATARRLLVRIWRMLTDSATYSPPPPPPLTDSQRNRRAARHVACLEDLGYAVSIERALA